MANPNPSKATRWKNGQSGNPRGRPLDPLTIAIREALETKHYHVTMEGKRRLLTEKEVQIQVLREKARAGDIKAMEMLWDRGFGKPVQAVDLMGELKTDSTVDLSITRLTDIARERETEKRRVAKSKMKKKNGKSKPSRKKPTPDSTE